MKVGYARTSTVEQQYGLDEQVSQLEKEGCEKVFSEQVSSVQQRPEFHRAMEFCREGDTLIVTKLDRFARSILDLWKHIEVLQDKGVSLHILDLGLNTESPTARLQLNLLGSIAQFEREIMLERQRVGIQRAKKEGKYKGRQPTARRQAKEIRRLHNEGMKPGVIAEELGIGIASVYRYRSA